MTKLFHLLNDYERAFTAGQKPATPYSDLQGRFIRMRPGEPDALTDDPDRRVVFLVDGQTLTDLVGLTGYQVCMAVGWDPDYTKGKVNAGYRFALAVFPKQNCKLGTWDNILDAVERVYPEIAQKISMHRASLRQMTPASLAQMEQRLGYRLLDVDQAPGAKKNDPRFMTIDRYKSAPDTADMARAFLYFTVHLKELFYGDGWTRTRQGQRGVEEYIMPALPMSDLGEHKVLPIQVQIPRVAIHTRAPAKGELPLPDFFNPDNAAEWGYQPLLQSYLPSQPKGLFDHADEWRAKHKVAPAARDTAIVTLVPIDMQNDFCHPNGTLYVSGRSGNGAIEDCAKVAQLIYRDAARITQILPSMDTHFGYQIFFSAFWQTADGGKVGCHRTITTDQIRKGEVAPAPAMAKWLCSGNYPWLQRQVLHYCEELEKAGKYELYLWPPHCILGFQGHALNGVVAEAMMFHAYLRHAQLSPEIKGGHPLTENYSILRPEVLTRFDGKPLAQKNTAFIKTLLTSDAVILAGEASSHCVASTTDDLLSEILAQDPSLARKCYVLADCMSAVVVPGGRDFTPEAEAALARFKAAGMHVVSSTTPMSDWPDFPAA
jgi:nicotinamidase-related amidase